MTRIIILLPILFLLSSASAQDSFVNVADSSGVYHYYADGSGGGVSFYDFDGDGLDDLTFATSYNEFIHFYKNTGGAFERIDFPGINNIYNSKHVLWVDYDNDGDSDLFVTSFYQNLLYENLGDMEFEEVTEAVGLPMTFEPTYGAAWGDFDRDGWIDLYVTDKKTGADFKNVSNHLYRNLNGESFEEITLQSNAADSAKAPFCAAFFDINNNGWQDIYIAQDRVQGNSMLKNLGNGTFQDYGKISGTDLKMNGMCVTVSDYNNDQLLDIYVTNTPEGNALFRNNGDETFSEVAGESGVGFYEIGWGSSFLDYDNNGLQDLFVCNMFNVNSFYVNEDGENFSCPDDLGFDNIAVSYASATGDINNDGFPDLVVNNADYFLSTLWLNPANFSNNWLKVKLRGMYSNREGIGCRLVAHAGGSSFTRYTYSGSSYLGQDSQYPLFGLGENQSIDSLEVFWLSGIRDVYYSLDVNQIIELTEGEATSISPALNASGTLTLCNTESFALNTGYFGDQFSYLWSDGSTTSTLSPLQDGMYHAMVTDPLGNSYFTDTLQITYIDGPVVTNAIVRNMSCFDLEDGSIELMIESGSPPYLVSWSQDLEGSMITGLRKGKYDYVITDSMGCTVTGSYIITEPNPLAIAASREHAADESFTGSLEITVFGGTPPYDFIWDHDQGETGSRVNNLEAGLYGVTVIDSMGCTVSREFEILALTVTGTQVEEPKVKIYPNPASEVLIVELPEVETIQIFDMSGKKKLEATHDYFEIRDLSNGIYFLKIGNQKSRRILINNP